MTVQILPKVFAFLKRDFLIAISYKLQFVMQVASIFISTVTFFFLSKLIGPGIGNQLGPYGGDYFSFVIIGVAFTDYLTVSLNTFSSQIRNAQVEGTIEALLVTPTSVPTILFSSTLYTFFFTSLRIVFYILFSTMFFGLQIQLTSFLSFIITLALTVAAFSGIGLISAAFIIVFKQGSPVSWAVSLGSGLLGGVFYPVSVLPGWLIPVSSLLPITHALEAMRQVLLNGAPLHAVYDSILILTLFAAILLPTGLLAFGYGLRLARKEGSLIHY